MQERSDKVFVGNTQPAVKMDGQGNRKEAGKLVRKEFRKQNTQVKPPSPRERGHGGIVGI